MTRKKKTLVILSPAFPGDERETTWVISQQLLVKALRKNFPQLPIVVLAFLYPYHAAAYPWKGVKVISFGGMQERKWRRIILWVKIWKTIEDIRREDGIEGIISFWCGECALIGKYFGTVHRIKHFCWICGQDARKTNRFVKFIRPKPGELVAMSDFLVNEFYRSHAVRPLYIIPNGIDPELFTGGINGGRNIDIMGAGSLEPLKQYSTFVRIVKAVQHTVPHVNALLCGDGTEKEALETLIKDLQMENNLRLPGLTPHREVLRHMQHSKVFLHTSGYEGFSAVCFEALYAGAQVVSFCDPMQRDMLHWHVVKTEEEMIRKALELLLSPDTEYTPALTYTIQNSAKAFGELLDGSSVMKQNISFYNEIADKYNDVMHGEGSNVVIRGQVKEKFLPLLSSGNVLDFGGGTGLDLEWLAPGHTVFFCEPSVAMREKAIQHSREAPHNDNITFLETCKTDFTRWHEELPFSEKMDAILANFGVVNYIPDIRLLFSRLALVMKPGGHFIAVILALSLKKRLRRHRRNAIRSLIFHSPFIMYVPSQESRQTVFVHTVKEIIKASGDHFEYDEHYSLAVNDFILIHLTRK